MESDSIASSWGRKRLVVGLLIALSVLAIPAAVLVPFSSWLGSLEANSAMAATPAPIDGKRFVTSSRSAASARGSRARRPMPGSGRWSPTTSRRWEQLCASSPSRPGTRAPKNGSTWST